MILNKFIQFITRGKTHIFCTHYQFYGFRKHLARFTTPLAAQDTSKLTENKRNTGRYITQISEKGVND